jgi:4-amino-4-deoxy-L-arabinose transferase-like glycosyltransferase
MSRLLHPDALLAPLMAASALSGLIAWRDGRWPYVMLSEVAGGLALLTKAPAIFLPGFFVLVGLVVARPWRSPRRWLVTVLCWGIDVGARRCRRRHVGSEPAPFDSPPAQVGLGRTP